MDHERSFICNYKKNIKFLRIPSVLRATAADMIVAMLQPHPSKRPSVNKLFNFEFLTGSAIPLSLPTSCLTMPPRADQLEYMDRLGSRKPLSMMNGMSYVPMKQKPSPHKPSPRKEQNKMGPYPNDKAYHRDVKHLQRDLQALLTELVSLSAINLMILEYLQLFLITGQKT